MTPIEVHHPRDKAVKGMVCAVPTFGMVHWEFAASMAQQAMPINFGMTWIAPGWTQGLKNVKWDWEENKVVPYGEWLKKYKPASPPKPYFLEVAEARNICAQFVLDHKIEWLYFRDDDTVAPPDAINKLFSDKLPIVGGNYMSKQQPPHHLILQGGYLAGYDEWRMGEVIECDNIGMGMTLIHHDVLKKIEDEKGRPWFKTIHCLGENDIQDIAPGGARMTEDVYFCTKARAVGYKIHVDTGVQGVHIDVKSNTKYYYHPGLEAGCWEQDDGRVMWYPKGDHPQRGSAASQLDQQRTDLSKQNPDFKPLERPVRLDIGAPGIDNDKRWKTVDLYEPSDLTCDIRDLSGLLPQTGFPDEMRASHVLEHFQAAEIVKTMKHWFKFLRPGGRLWVMIPDFTWAAEKALEHKDGDPDDYWQVLMMVYGRQANPGDIHRCPFTMTPLVKLMKFTGFEIEGQWVEQYVDPLVQRSCIVVGRKPAGINPEVSDAEGLLDLEEIKREREKDILDAAAIYNGSLPRQEMYTPFLQPEVKDDETVDRQDADSGGDGRSDSSGTDSDGKRTGAAEPSAQGSEPETSGQSGEPVAVPG
jgi:hypothetical protein